jgi:hypothetical protein
MQCFASEKEAVPPPYFWGFLGSIEPSCESSAKGTIGIAICDRFHLCIRNVGHAGLEDGTATRAIGMVRHGCSPRKLGRGIPSRRPGESQPLVREFRKRAGTDKIDSLLGRRIDGRQRWPVRNTLASRRRREPDGAHSRCREASAVEGPPARHFSHSLARRETQGRKSHGSSVRARSVRAASAALKPRRSHSVLSSFRSVPPELQS